MKEPRFLMTLDRSGQLVMTWSNPPGLDSEFYPDELKLLADRLLELVRSAPLMAEVLN